MTQLDAVDRRMAGHSHRRPCFPLYTSNSYPKEIGLCGGGTGHIAAPRWSAAAAALRGRQRTIPCTGTGRAATAASTNRPSLPRRRPGPALRDPRPVDGRNGRFSTPAPRTPDAAVQSCRQPFRNVFLLYVFRFDTGRTLHSIPLLPTPTGDEAIERATSWAGSLHNGAPLTTAELSNQGNRVS